MYRQPMNESIVTTHRMIYKWTSNESHKHLTRHSRHVNKLVTLNTREIQIECSPQRELASERAIVYERAIEKKTSATFSVEYDYLADGQPTDRHCFLRIVLKYENNENLLYASVWPVYFFFFSFINLEQFRWIRRKNAWNSNHFTWNEWKKKHTQIAKKRNHFEKMNGIKK